MVEHEGVNSRLQSELFSDNGSIMFIIGTPQTMRTPMVNPVPATPSINLQSVDAATIQRAAAGLPSNIYNTLAQVAGATPAQQFSNNQQQQGSFNTGYRGGFNFNVSLLACDLYPNLGLAKYCIPCRYCCSSITVLHIFYRHLILAIFAWK